MVCVQRAREVTSRQSASNFSFRLLNVCYPRARRASHPCRSLEWRLGEETGPSYAVGSSVSRGSNGAIACYLCAALPPFMPPPRRPATPRPTSTVAAACALGVLAGGGELQLERTKKLTPLSSPTFQPICLAF